MSTTLGKRKEREEDPEAHGFTLFVSNLPYTATSTDLQTLFSDIAPVRSAFIVTEAGTGVSKGVGYVSFAIKEDAQSAYETISKEGINLVGRTLRVQWADSKPKDGEKIKKEPKPRPAPHPKAPHDPNAIRTIVITGLPSTIDSKTLWKKIRKLSGAEKVEWPLEGQEGTAHAIFSAPSDAQDAVTKLHAHVFKGALLSVALKKRLDASIPSTAPSHSSRLIVRNIPFGLTEQDLRSVFLPFGPVHSINIPTYEEEGKTRMKGFAFVWMVSRKDAERALEGCNGMTMKVGMAEDLLLDKIKKKKVRREEKKGADGLEKDSRIVAVDWALSKNRWEEEKAKMDVDASENESDDEDEQLGVHADDDESGSESDGDSEDENSDAPVKPELPPPETGNTLFVRNVPFEATEDDLRTLFRAFGPLRYARITMDPVTGRSRGTGFACFWNREDADKAIDQCELLRAETGSSDAPKKNPFTLPSILTPDPSSMLARSLVLQGRTLDVVRAVTRDQAGKLKDDGEKQREKADKRNMYLLREGVILPNTPAADTLSPAEVERRTASFNSRRTLLKSNPSLYISKTRLSIRQIPNFVTERLLKRLAAHAVIQFDKEVKAGRRAPLTPDELAEITEENEGEEEKKKKKGKGKGPAVKQSKIVRAAERIDPVTGKGRSKGYGFLEMYSHPDSLRVLRWSNNNPDVGPLFETWWKDELEALAKAEKAKEKDQRDDDRLKRIKDELEKSSEERRRKVRGALIVEFSIENVQVVQRRAAIQKRDPSEKRKREDGGKGGRTSKKVKTEAKTEEEPQPTSKADDKPSKAGQSIGGLIGRKRKERKSKKH